MAMPTPKKCFKCGKIKLIGDCIVGMPICDDCRNKAHSKGGIKSALSDLIKEKLGKDSKAKK